MPLIFSLSNMLLSYRWSIISYSYPLITSYELALDIIVSPPNLKVVAAVDGVVTSAFGGILFDFFYYNYSSKYITEPYRRYYSRFVNRLGI